MRHGAFRNNVLFSEAKRASPAPAHSKPRLAGLGLGRVAVINMERLTRDMVER